LKPPGRPIPPVWVVPIIMVVFITEPYWFVGCTPTAWKKAIVWIGKEYKTADDGNPTLF